MFTILPESVVMLLPALSLLFIGHAVERHYVGRITCFTNSLALVVHYVTVDDPGLLLRLHANIGLLLGVIGFIAYYKHRSLPGAYYSLSYLGYGSLVVGTIILYPQILWLFGLIFTNSAPGAALFAFLVIVYNTGLLLFTGGALIHMGARPASVDEFIQRYEVAVPDGRGYVVMTPLTHWFDD
ncbi:hypothetical protein [Natronosalvus halobius]|uniref:hypothetical protein n=1 Tax=Natronosalvus halobius TaxID=2953746 RepID=UPI0020A0E8F1|nr:hypothetical protein [Natronosalvus halobius]USZ71256.1 hypothetical protein NGM15_14400 [Natronosalvus halobius]